uniref:flagellin N-terminal helical domain-containing protein n=1 Tax=Shewanella sp. TaxID=50422 RepID=UPI0040472497
MTVINTNIKSLISRDALTANNRQLSTAMERLSTGKRINSAADDAAGLSISSRMESQVRGLQMSVKNANDAISVTQTAEGAMQEINDILQRMRELSVQASSDSNSAQDRVYLQDEISQLSDEIDRIASATQFNGINVLDGGFSDKKFQIGANAGQTMDITIGDMRASVLGVASATSASSTSSSSAASSATTNILASARGTSAVTTQARLSFPDAAGATYTFDIADAGTSLSGAVSTTLDLGDSFSKQDFVDHVNQVLAQSATNTDATGGVTGSGSTTLLDVSDTDDYDGFKFAIKIGDSSLENINIRQALRDAGVSTNATSAQIVAAIQSELRSVFDDTNTSITVSATSGFISVNDAEGRRIEITQGAGDGTLFGTDSENGDESILVEASTSNGISAAWDGDELVLTNSTGDQINVHSFAPATSGIVMSFAPVTGQNLNELDPIVFTSGTMSTIDGTNRAEFIGVVEETSLAMTFSNREAVMGYIPVAGVGNGTQSTQSANAQYAFDITNGDGDVYFSTSLNLADTRTDAQIITAVKTALSAGIATNFTNDTSIDMTEFDVQFNNNTLTITNSSGRALKIENFESYAGTMTVASLSDLGTSEELASQNRLFSETRIAINPSGFGVDYGDTVMRFTMDGRSVGGTAFSIDFDGVTNRDLSAMAVAIQADLRAMTDLSAVWGTSDLGWAHDNSLITVGFDLETNELIIRHPDGEELGIGVSSSATGLYDTGALFVNNFTSGIANKSNAVNTSSEVIQGAVLEATRVKMTLNEDIASFGFTIGGTTVSNTLYDATEAFAGSALEIALDAAMDSLNEDHPDAVFEYSVSGREITFLQRDGGEIVISDFTTATGYETVAATIEAVGFTTGETKIAQEYDASAAVTASAVGTLATKTEAILTLSQDDIYSMVINDGVQDYTLSSTVVDLSDSNSTQAFSSALETALLGSTISVGMDTSGRVYFSRDDGGEINLTSINSLGSGTATWVPKSGQGDSVTLSDSVASSSTTSTTSVSSTSTTGTVAVSQISVSTQEEAVAALAVIDNALDYVNSERSKLGAVENRLTHTIDNLSNIITNTAAAKSRIVDTDYAVETAELARAQIVQQAATAMLAQANQSSQSVLSLLQ